MTESDNKVKISANVAYPSQLAPYEEKKQTEWGLQLARSIESDWFYGFTNAGGVLNSKFNTQRQDMLERRLYAKGLQSMDKYKDNFKANGDKSFLNLSTKPISIIPKLVDIVVNGMVDRGYAIKATSVDPTGYDKRLAFRQAVETDMVAKEFIDKAKEMYGVDVSASPMQELPESEEELNLYMNLTYKQEIEMAQELAIDQVLTENRYNDTTDSLIKRDLTVLGVAWAKHKFVPERGIVVEHVNAENKVQSYSEDPYFRDCFYHGEYKTVPISEVLTEFQWLNEPKYEEQKRQVTESSQAWWDYNLMAENDRIKGTTNLLYFTYKTTRTRASKIKEKKTGEKIVSKAYSEFDEKALKKGQKNDFKRVAVEEEIIFEGVYVLGTNLMLKWECAENMIRPKSNRQKVIDQYIGVAPNKERGYIDSPVARMIPVEDKLNILELKAEQIIQKIKPDGFIIDPDAIAELDFGKGNVLTVQNMVDMFEQTGSIFARSYNSGGDQMFSKPITELKTGDSLAKLSSLIQLKAQYMDQMRDVIGLNKVSDASTPDKESLVGVQKLASLNSNIATRHILRGASDITKRMAEAITYRVADLLKYSDLKDDFAMKIGTQSVQILDSVKNLHLHDFAIHLDLELDDEERAKLEADLTLEIQRGTLSFEDKYKILAIKNFKYAVEYASILRSKREKKNQEIKAQEYKIQADENIRAATAANESKMQTEQAIGQIKMMLQQAVNEGEINKERVRGEEERKTVQVKGQYDIEIAQMNGGIQVHKQNMAEDRKDDRTKLQATQQSELIDQRAKDKGPKDFEDDFDLGDFEI